MKRMQAGALVVPGSDTARSHAGIRVEMVERLRARHSEIAQAIYVRIREAVPDPVGGRDRAYQAGMLAAVTAVLGCCLEAIEHGPAWAGPIPAEAVAQAHRAARASVSLGAVLRRYVAGHRRLGEFVEEETEHIGLSSNGPALHHIRRTQEALLEHLTAAIEREYNQERQRAARSPRHAVVQRLLAGVPVDPTELHTLGYELDAWHLCAIVTGRNAEKAVRRLAVAHGRELLPVACGGEMWAWLGGQCKFTITGIEHVLSAKDYTDVSVAIGEVARGIEGWRLTHREAEAAQQVARYRPCRLTRYLDVAPEANALQDEALASSLIETHLSPLDDMRIGGQIARRTLRALFDTEHNVSSAAHRLDVDRSTVHRRRNEIEQRLGCRLHEHQVNIEIALRVEELLKRRDSAQPSVAAS
jgi:DNA-binding PucR family transcriptional regulator